MTYILYQVKNGIGELGKYQPHKALYYYSIINISNLKMFSVANEHYNQETTTQISNFIC